jgi:hypothetical protein
LRRLRRLRLWRLRLLLVVGILPRLLNGIPVRVVRKAGIAPRGLLRAFAHPAS